MATAKPPVPTGPRGPQKKLDTLEPPSEAAKYLPYIAAAAVVIGLIATIVRSPTYAVHATATLLVCGSLGLGYIASQDAHALPPDDSFRKAVAAGTIAVVFALLGAVALTLYPPAPYGTATLQRAGDTGAITVTGSAANLFVETSGTFEADVGPSAQAKYTMHVVRDGAEEELEGTFERSAGQSPLAGGTTVAAASTESTSSRHWLTALRGSGRYVVTLDRMPENLRPPIRASIRGEPFAPWMFTLAFALLAVLVLVIDVGIAKRGIEPTYAPALLLALVFVYYLHGHYAGTNDGLLAALLVAILGGGLGGEALARISRKIAG